MARTTDRRAATSILGDCPNCGGLVTRAGLLALYRAEGEWPRMLAACSACDEIVDPV
jgi:hypothetical protein